MHKDQGPAVLRSNQLSAYLLAVAVSIAVIGLRLLLPGFFGEANWFIQSHPAVLLAAWKGGLGPGLLASAFTILAAAFFFVPPQFAFPTARQELNLTATAAGIAVLISVLTDALRRSRHWALVARHEAERANRAKDEFLATVSHELRTPLTVVLGWVHMLKERQLSPEDQRHAIQAIYRNSLIQSRLVDNVLELSEVNTGRLSLHLEAVDFTTIARETAETLTAVVTAKQQQLRLDLQSSCFVRGDARRLRQVLWNVLSNASKFTPDGGWIELGVRKYPAHIVCWVTDTGQGVEQAFQPHMFDVFRQADSSPTRAHGGLGLGLALVRRLVEAHGGHVSAHSAGLGEGTRIEIQLPPLLE